jgi:Zn-dependent M28 family amino/carboxypeptidase
MHSACLLFFLFCATAGVTAVRFELLDRNTVIARLKSCPKNDLDRQAQLATYFEQAGCTGSALTLDRANHSKFGNVICTLPGISPDQIVVGAHFDHAEHGSGAVDNWSGASFLPSLYQALAAGPRKHTFVFVGFWGEERGLLGSQQYVHKLRKEDLAKIDAMVNMDTFGAGPTEFWIGHSDPRLENAAVALASAMKLPIQGLRIEHVSTDSETFREKKVPSIEFCAMTQSTLRLLHSSEDQVSRINQDDYYNAYHLLAAYLAYIDQVVPSRVEVEK